MPPTTSVSSASSENIPSLSHTATTSVTNSMPVSPRTASPGLTDQVKIANGDGDVKPEVDGDQINAEELVQEIQEEGESDPQRGRRMRRLSRLSQE
ncbi:hypothetical protein L486_02518 [Kwoniella mangroviensis CBS 10435]|uniref:Uncharacterized protein n=1 Tax=Kwoniella mangroviensis CBS 10435 TaxID=1331196 RepID=A0A1B9IWD1_9TREE|nr:uncharacterized protein I203_01643 [Kwoniella mangroviensis CBS 8507]OCF59845.1 hypothetical protein L486_02518 [Kwoniella mangroviensis CBS 10435]OCF69779.1 hypothetical protein I203_01643 [Kwoniella mangroviensis CBS 8507]OCF71368.1 hypothetical protein I204_07995 [Kwoniella mangroviensis CBS 8886]